MFRKTHAVRVLSVGLAMVIPALSPASDKAKTDPPVVQPAAEVKTATPVPVYKPPLRGAPVSRVGGASRGPGDTLATVAVLAPEHTGWTTQAQPSLYWYVSRPAVTRVELTVIDERTLQPLLEVSLPVPEKAGIQRLVLAEQGITLKPEVEYQWSVALVPDPEERSKDMVASGTIKHVLPSEALSQRLKAASRTELPYLYAAEGYWYDAIAAISELINQRPHDAGLREQRSALLRQVGLAEAAQHDKP